MSKTDGNISFKVERRLPDVLKIEVAYWRDGKSHTGSFAVFYPGTDAVSMDDLIVNKEFQRSYRGWLKDGRFTPRSLREDV